MNFNHFLMRFMAPQSVTVALNDIACRKKKYVYLFIDRPSRIMHHWGYNDSCQSEIDTQKNVAGSSSDSYRSPQL